MTIGEAAAAMQQEGKPARFYAEYSEAESGKCHGILPLESIADPEREVGYNGTRLLTIKAPMDLHRGHRLVMLKASKKKPRRLTERIYPMG